MKGSARMLEKLAKAKLNFGKFVSDHLYAMGKIKKESKWILT